MGSRARPGPFPHRVYGLVGDGSVLGDSAPSSEPHKGRCTVLSRGSSSWHPEVKELFKGSKERVSWGQE